MTSTPNSQLFIQALRDYQAGRYQPALEQMNDLIKLQPEGGQNWFALLGNIHFKTGNRELAGDMFLREAADWPERAPEFLKLAIALFSQCGAGSKVHVLHDEAVRLLSGDANTMHLVAQAAIQSGAMERARPLLDLTDPKKPQHVTTKCQFYRTIGDQQALWETLSQAVQDCPDDIFLKAARYAQARIVLDLVCMRDYEAIMAYPDDPFAHALLSAEKALDRLFWCRSEAVMARPSYDSTLLGMHTASLAPLRHPRRDLSAEGEKLKIGYLSMDFGAHSFPGGLSDMLGSHDPETVEITLFCLAPPDARAWQRDWPQALRDRIVPIYEKAVVEVIDLIRQMGIDILVDLMGHADGSRLEILNLADCPLKLSAPLYAAAPVGAELDYLLTDHIISPDASRMFHPEKLCLLPHSSLPGNRLGHIRPRPMTRRAAGLPDDRFVFCSFAEPARISPQMLALWRHILSSAPDSVLWLRLDEPLARRNLMTYMGELWIGEDRIVFAEKTETYQEHINRLALADLALDTAPWNSGEATVDLLRAGVPVVTLRGTSAQGRLTASLLDTVELDFLVADDADAYCALATALATDPAVYQALRLRLAEARENAPLFSPLLFARHLELAYGLMAERARAGLPPEPIIVPSLRAELLAEEAALEAALPEAIAAAA